jgi:site-specific DNA-methyltransferase (adenine-specific)
VLFDQHGETIDGRYLQRACEELGLDYTREVQEFTSDLERLQVAVTVNSNGRRWNRKKRRELIARYLKTDPGINDNHLGQIVGTSKNTVAAVRAELESTRQIDKLPQRRGRDGKERPAKYRRIVANTTGELEKAKQIIGDLPDNCAGKLLDITTAKRRAARQQNKKERAGRVVTPLADDAVRIYHGRFQDLEQIAGIVPESVNLVCTDIPYDQSFLPQVGDLGEFGARVLIEGGLLVTVCGQYWLHKVIAELGKHLNYRWTDASVWDGDATPVHIGGWKEPHARVLSKWKPILIFSKGGFPKRGQWCDVSHINTKEKDWHPWQQPLEEVEGLVRYFSDPGDLVIDPCGGGFTTAVACYRLGRRCISCDVDEQCVLGGQKRLAEEIVIE